MRKKDVKFPMIIGVAAIIVIVGIVISNNSNKEPDYSGMTEEEKIAAINEKIDKVDLTSLSEMSERERMERYLGKFIEQVKNKEYNVAYDMLNEDFKTNYFQTLETFEEYAKTKFPSRITVEYTNIERNGNIYVLWVNMGNPLRSKSESIEMNFVVKENALDDFELSFSVQ